MDHGVADLNSGRPAIDQNSSGLAFESWQQAAGAVQIGLVERRVGKKRLRGGDEQLSLALVRPLRRQAVRRAAGVLVLAQCCHAVSIGIGDSRGEHGLRRRLANMGAGDNQEVLEGRALPGDHQPGIGAELAGALGQRSDKALRQGFTARAQGAIEQEHRVDSAHFGIDRDRLRARLGRLAKGEATAARTGEADRLDTWISDQADA
ncbi:hypothetical protein WR25_24487 [Diploscapter pachys]|uniref:Uncharacterized protein n=1 Tax=Diploscapter pachys TaxID=2018661 RepID=A0A2A2KJ82_9BILA|nr:hypothetical protein WR25_24487 [Diploscapter pachys]